MASLSPKIPATLSAFLFLPQPLLETLLSTTDLHANDLTALTTAAVGHPAHPILLSTVEAAAHQIFRSTPYGRLLLSTKRPSESYLSLLHFLHRLDNPTPPAPSQNTQIFSCGRNDAGQGARPASGDVNVLLPTHRLSSPNADFLHTPASAMLIAAGANHSACISVFGALHLAGANRRGQLGMSDLVGRPAWTPVPSLRHVRVAQVACGAAHTVVLTGQDELLVAGANDYGQLGTGDIHQRIDFSKCAQFTSHAVSMLAAGAAHTVVLTEDGCVYATGDNANGQLGGRRDKGRRVFQPVGCFGRKVVRIACGSDTTMLLTVDNMVLVTGKRQCGMSVIGGLGISKVTHLSVGEGFAIASTAENHVAVSAHRKRFCVTDELLGVNAHCVSAGVSHYAIVTAEGGVLAGGANAFGQVAAGQMGLTIEGSQYARIIRPHRVPLSVVDIPPGYRALQVASGAFHTLYLLASTKKSG